MPTFNDDGRRGDDEIEEVEPVDAEAALRLDDLDIEVLREIDAIQKQKSSWAAAVLMFLVSLGLFAGAGGANNGPAAVLPLVGVILFHELGHYIAMRVFGYRNLKMFFIPFFGAAVSGKHYNVAGWKKTVVALAGPVPGIVVGIPLGIAGLVLKNHQLTDVAFLMMALNGFNLLPLLPLDGGWVMHATLFCRHPLLDVLFRGLAVAGLFALGVLMQAKLFFILPLGMALSIPAAWSTAATAHRLRRRGAVAVSPDSQSIPPGAALTILSAVRPAGSKPANARMLAQLVVNIFETLNARPPGVLASLALLGVHVAGFVAAFVFAGVLLVGQRGANPGPAQPAPRQPAALALPIPAAAAHNDLMAARDRIHDTVKAALVADGWTVTADPYTLKIDPDAIQIDMAAERLLALERGSERIAVEVKSFGGRSDVHEFHAALGQYMLYATFLRRLDPGRDLYLATPDVIFNGVFSREAFQLVMADYGLKVIVVDINRAEIVQWIT